jgi:hypothetical protein
MQYAPPPPVDYNANVAFQDSLNKNYKPTPMPQGFIDYFTLQREAQSRTLVKTATQPYEQPAEQNNGAQPAVNPNKK